MKVVIDTNVLVAGILTKSTAAKVVDMWLDKRFELLTSESQLTELKQILQAKFAEQIPSIQRAKLISAYAKRRLWSTPNSGPSFPPTPTTT
jgi:putative PIN family toxin of toxin-antitoxin system